MLVYEAVAGRGAENSDEEAVRQRPFARTQHTAQSTHQNVFFTDANALLCMRATVEVVILGPKYFLSDPTPQPRKSTVQHL